MNLLKKYAHPLLISLGLLAVHGLLLLNDGIYFDGWRIYHAIEHGTYTDLHAFFYEIGQPISAAIYWMPQYMGGNVTGHKIALFLSLWACALLIYASSRQWGEALSPVEGMLLALIFLFYPAYQIGVDVIMLPYQVSYVGFLAGFYLALHLDDYRGPAYGFGLLRAGALFGFLLSFFINSFLVFYGGALLLLALRAGDFGRPLTMGRRFLLHWGDFLLLPLIFWALRVRPSEDYATYNTFQVNFSQWIADTLSFIRVGILAPLPFESWLASPGMLLAGAAIAYAYHVGWVKIKNEKLWQQGPAWPLMALGLLGFGLAIFPYVVVGKSPLAHGWSTRHALLVSLPLGLLILGVWRLIFARLRPIWGLGFMALLLLSYAQAHYVNYFQLQAFWVKNQAISQDLRALPLAAEVDVFWIDDRFPVGWPEMSYYNREWGGIFRYTWPEGNAAGIYWDESNGGYYWLTLNRAAEPLINIYEPQGCQAILTIRRGDRPTRYSPEGLSIRYLFYRYLNPGGLEDFLGGVAEVEVRRILAPQATLCPAEAALLPSLPQDDPLRNDNERGDKHLLRLLYIHLLETQNPPPNELAAWKLAGLGEMNQSYRAQQLAALGGQIPAYPVWLAEYGIDPDFYTLYYQVSGLQAESTEP